MESSDAPSRLANYRKRKKDAPISVLVQSSEWAPFVRFVNGWNRTPLSKDTGCSTEELNEAEEEFGQKMPAAMREWYQLIGAHESFLDETSQDYEMPLERVGEDSRWLKVFGENQDC